MGEGFLKLGQGLFFFDQGGGPGFGGFHNVGDSSLLLQSRRERKREGADLGFVRGCQVRRALGDAVKVPLGDVGLDDQGKELRQQEVAVRANAENVVLVKAIGDPNCGMLTQPAGLGEGMPCRGDVKETNPRLS